MNTAFYNKPLEWNPKRPTTLKELAQTIAEINEANGWSLVIPSDWTDDKYKIPAVLALIHSELSEALEDFREDNLDHFGEEIADVIIRCLDLTDGLNIDIDKEIADKLKKNRKRAHKHGGKRI